MNVLKMLCRHETRAHPIVRAGWVIPLLTLIFAGAFGVATWAGVGTPLPANGVNGIRTTVLPAAKVKWADLVRIDQAKSALVLESLQVRPFMKMPASMDIGVSGVLSPRPDVLATPALSPQALIPPLTTSFQALPDNAHVIPPDTHGAVSKIHVMTMLNSQVRIQSRSGGVVSTVNLATFWAPAGGTTLSDPRLLYDQSTDRWLASCLANPQTTTSSVLLAVSSTGDPTGSWTFYRIDADSTNVNWADYDDIGFNGTWIAITSNMFTVSSNAFSGAAMWVIDKSTALAGGPLTTTSFPVGSDTFGGLAGFTLRVCQTFGVSPTLYIVDNSGVTSGGTNLLRMTQITGTGPAPVWSAVPGSSRHGSGLFAASNAFSTNQVDASQLGTTTRISTNDIRMINAVYRNGRIWCTHTGGLPVNSVDRTAVFWYELNPAAMPSPIVQSGVLNGGANVHYYYPSIAVNLNNDAIIGFTRSDPARYAEAAYTGRLAADPAGTMAPIVTLKAGEASYVKDFGSGQVRWGDYSGTVVDPLDDLSFWTIQEYAAMDVGPNPNDDRWGTWWGRISSVTTGNNPPTAICQNVTANAGATCTATVTAAMVNNGSFDLEDGTNLTLALTPQGPYPVGTTAVSLIVTDSQGASDTCAALITVADHTAPVITCPAPIVVNNAAGQCGAIVTFNPTVTDNCPGAAIVSTPPSGSLFPIGSTLVTCVASDASGNKDTCQFTVTVRDAEPPVVKCPADTTLIAPSGQTAANVSFTSSVTDNCAGAVVACNPPSGSLFPAGVTHVTCIGTDAAGNKDTCGFNITVELCACPHQGDIAPPPAGDGLLDVFDIIQEITIAFSGVSTVQDPQCPKSRSDVNNDGITDVFDVIYLVATVFSGGPNPVNPCGP